MSRLHHNGYIIVCRATTELKAHVVMDNYDFARALAPAFGGIVANRENIERKRGRAFRGLKKAGPCSTVKMREDEIVAAAESFLKQAA